MIQLILDAYIEKTKYKLSKNDTLKITLAMISIISALVFMALGLNKNKYYFIGLIASVLFLSIIIAKSCNNNKTTVKQRSIEHNERLDKLKDILSSFTFTDNKGSNSISSRAFA